MRRFRFRDVDNTCEMKKDNKMRKKKSERRRKKGGRGKKNKRVFYERKMMGIRGYAN